MSTATPFDTSRTRPSRRTRHDPLAEYERPPADVRQVIRTFMGVVLLLVGLAVCLWLVSLVHAAVFRTGRLDLLRRLAPAEKEEWVMTVPAGNIELPAGLMRLASYALLIPFAFVGAKVGVAILKEGCWLLRNERVTIDEDTPPALDGAAANPDAAGGSS